MLLVWLRSWGQAILTGSSYLFTGGALVEHNDQGSIQLACQELRPPARRPLTRPHRFIDEDRRLQALVLHAALNGLDSCHGPGVRCLGRTGWLALCSCLEGLSPLSSPAPPPCLPSPTKVLYLVCGVPAYGHHHLCLLVCHSWDVCVCVWSARARVHLFLTPSFWVRVPLLAVLSPATSVPQPERGEEMLLALRNIWSAEPPVSHLLGSQPLL